LLPAGIEVAALQYPGRESRVRETPYLSVAELSRDLAACVAQEARERDRACFAFFGHSVGALVAFETARVLRRRGEAEPKWLFASGRGAPRIPEPGPPMHGLDEASLTRELSRRYGHHIPAEVLAEPEMLRLVLPGLRADLAMNETYSYSDGEPLHFPITAMGGFEDSSVSETALDAWQHETTFVFRRVMFQGGHFFIQTHTALVARSVAEDLARNTLSASA
jgi:surfactin synthase thioesterase subunit